MSESTRLKNELLEQARADAAEARSAERGLDNVPALTPNYEQAGQATEPLEPPSPGPPHPSVTRPTSYAKTLDQPVQQPANDQPPTGRGSEMVEKDKPTPEPSNTMEEAKAVKASEFNKAWQAEQSRANDDLEAARRDAAEAKAAEVEAAQEREQEQGLER